MREHERFNEYFDQLAEAVFAGQLQRAEGVLDEMQRIGLRSEAIRRSKRRVRPDLRYTAEMARPMVLPVPGHIPGLSTLANPVTVDALAEAAK